MEIVKYAEFRGLLNVTFPMRARQFETTRDEKVATMRRIAFIRYFMKTETLNIHTTAEVTKAILDFAHSGDIEQFLTSTN